MGKPVNHPVSVQELMKDYKGTIVEQLPLKQIAVKTKGDKPETDIAKKKAQDAITDLFINEFVFKYKRIKKNKELFSYINFDDKTQTTIDGDKSYSAYGVPGQLTIKVFPDGQICCRFDAFEVKVRDEKDSSQSNTP